MDVNTSLQRLNFTLPAFKRIAWVSDEARRVWDTRIRSLAESCLQVKLQMLLDGRFSCMVLQLAAWEYLKMRDILERKGIHHAILETINEYEPGKFNTGFVKPVAFKIVTGNKINVEGFEDAFHSGDTFSTAALLAIPTCCSNFYKEKYINEGWRDLSWSRALNSQTLNWHDSIAGVSFSPTLNLFWKFIGIEAITYQPCSFDCKCSESMGETFFKTGDLLGMCQEMEWIRNILAWPVEWSALHGIAEIKTPVLRLSTNTDAIAQKVTIHLQSNVYPDEGAKGLNFPFQQPGFKRISDSKAFKKGLENKINMHQ